MKTINSQNPKDSDTISGVSFLGLTLAVQLKALAGQYVSGSTFIIDTSKLILKATLTGRGENQKDVILFNENLRDLMAASDLHSPEWEFIANPLALIALDNPFVTGNKAMIPLRVRFGGPIDCRNGHGSVKIEWNLMDGFFNATVIDPAGSFISLDEIICEEAEHFTPILTSYLVEPNQPNPKWSLGDNVHEIMLANYDKATVWNVDQVLIDYTLNSSNGYNDSKRFNDLFVRECNQYADFADAILRLQKFYLYKDHEVLDGANIELHFLSTNLNAGKNILLVRSFVTSDWHKTRAELHEATVEMAGQRKGSFNDGIAKKILA